ncbi:hypothetical protein GCM10010201_20740 [Pilimelia columellifera subsp. columellifera]|uniref:Uncharacterized protein n=2 Tax=Pilimelia TaxID=53370 RepID=A0ABN3NHN6_9ACTN
MGFITAPSGTGKTTAVFALSSLLPEKYEPVFAVPSTVSLRDLPRWLNEKLPTQTSRNIPVLIDNREQTDDDIGLGQLMSSLNGIARTRPDLVILWPTTDDDWRDSLLNAARKVGGKTLAPAAGELSIGGPSSTEWPTILERLLIQLDQTLEELAIDVTAIEVATQGQDSVGAFLETIRDMVTTSVEEVRLARSLPRLLFVVSSDSAVVGEANRLRRAGQLNIKAEELVSYSSRSISGKYWKARLKNPSHHLAYVISLFQARLVTMTPSSVSYAALHHGDHDLQQLTSKAGLSRNATNAATTFRNTDFYRFLTATTSAELTSTSKGRTADATLAAYEAIQAVSARRHKAVNQAICGLVEQVVPEFSAAKGAFEVDLGDSGAFADAVILMRDEELHLEFHHLSPAHCKASSMAAYIMEKLKTYALHYNLIPR